MLASTKFASSRALTTSTWQSRAGRAARLDVSANKKVVKKTQVVLAKPVPSLGAAGDLVTVPLGYARNYLKPNRLASPATAGVLAGIEKAAAAAAAAAAAEKERARAMATALATIGKFVVKKKAGEGDALFGTVTAADVCDAIFQQTGKQLDKRAVTLPDIKTVGTYDATVKLHADVVGAFKVIVQKEKNA